MFDQHVASSQIEDLSEMEALTVSGGHDAYTVRNGTYAGQINGNGGHWDAYNVEGQLVFIWSAD